MTVTQLVIQEAVRCCSRSSYRSSSSRSSGGFSWADYYLFHYLWDHFRWWAIAIYGAVVVVIRGAAALLGAGQD